MTFLSVNGNFVVNSHPINTLYKLSSVPLRICSKVYSLNLPPVLNTCLGDLECD